MMFQSSGWVTTDVNAGYPSLDQVTRHGLVETILYAGS
jgi:hypothetical protein